MICIFLVGGEGKAINSAGHECSFTQQVISEKYFKEAATCQYAEQYYYSCSCGKHGEETFEVGSRANHVYTAERAEEEYLKSPANCLHKAEYFKSCENCEKHSWTLTFEYGATGDCNYTEEVVKDAYIKSEATTTESAVYHKSCICGNKGEAMGMQNLLC